MSGPVLPVRRVTARYDARADKWLPCRDRDARGSLIMQVDAEGRTVLGQFAGSPFGNTGVRLVGWKLTSQSNKHDPDAFRVWLLANPMMEATK